MPLTAEQQQILAQNVSPKVNQFLALLHKMRLGEAIGEALLIDEAIAAERLKVIKDITKDPLGAEELHELQHVVLSGSDLGPQDVHPLYLLSQYLEKSGDAFNAKGYALTGKITALLTCIGIKVDAGEEMLRETNPDVEKERAFKAGIDYAITLLNGLFVKNLFDDPHWEAVEGIEAFADVLSLNDVFKPFSPLLVDHI